MEQLILHLLGDYVFQSHWMAKNKSKAHWPAFAHAFIYSLPFWIVFRKPEAVLVILLTHFLIDRYSLARYVVWAKNVIFVYSNDEKDDLDWSDCNKTGYPNTVPDWMAIWLLITADNTIHLAINYSALRWL